MKDNYSKNSQNTQTNFNQGLQPITQNTFEYLEKTISRFKKSKKRTDTFLRFAEKIPLDELKEKHITKNIIESVNGCGSWLEFRNYIQVDKTKLHNANFCKKDKLCPACAMRRASKQVKKVFDYFEQNPNLKAKHWYYIVLPVKHNITEDFETVFDRARNGLQSLRMAIKDNKRGKGNKSFFSQFEGFMYSFEVTKTKNGWNNHINLLCCSDTEIKGIYKKGKTYVHNGIMQDWSRFTDNQSFVHSINKVDVSNEEDLIKNLLEIFKYSLKFQDLSNDDLLEVYSKTYRKRLLGAFGTLYGIKTDVNLNGDEVLGDKFLEIIYRYNFKTKEYFEYQRNVKDVPASRSSLLVRRVGANKEKRREPKPKFRVIEIFDTKGNLVQYKRIPILKNFTHWDIFKKTLKLAI